MFSYFRSNPPLLYPRLKPNLETARFSNVLLCLSLPRFLASAIASRISVGTAGKR